jgi:hypothetical protein
MGRRIAVLLAVVLVIVPISVAQMDAASGNTTVLHAGWRVLRLRGPRYR